MIDKHGIFCILQGTNAIDANPATTPIWTGENFCVPSHYAKLFPTVQECVNEMLEAEIEGTIYELSLSRRVCQVKLEFTPHLDTIRVNLS